MTTPGPWEAVERIDGYWEVRGDHADCAEGVPLRQEDDVRLMARAPDLLAALATARAEGFREGCLASIDELDRQRAVAEAQGHGEALAYLDDLIIQLRLLGKGEP